MNYMLVYSFPNSPPPQSLAQLTPVSLSTPRACPLSYFRPAMRAVPSCSFCPLFLSTATLPTLPPQLPLPLPPSLPDPHPSRSLSLRISYSLLLPTPLLHSPSLHFLSSSAGKHESGQEWEGKWGWDNN